MILLYIHIDKSIFEVKFNSGPSWKVIEEHIILAGCKYISNTSAEHHQSYWLMNEKHKMEAEHIYLGDGVFRFKDLSIVSFNMTGDYQCVVENNNDGEKMVSEKVDFKELTKSK